MSLAPVARLGAHENWKGGESRGEAQSRGEMNGIESAHGLDREGSSSPDADVRGDLQHMPVRPGLAELAAESANLSDSRWSLALGPCERPLRLQERQ